MWVGGEQGGGVACVICVLRLDLQANRGGSWVVGWGVGGACVRGHVCLCAFRRKGSTDTERVETCSVL